MTPPHAHLAVDALIAGGGIAGCCAAAALAQLGWRVLIVEPGAHASQPRRLAGEVIHPPGIEGLVELGLLDAGSLPGSALEGVMFFPVNAGAAPVTLPYRSCRGVQGPGRAIEHRMLKQQLLERVGTLPGVELWLDSRVAELERQADGGFVPMVRRGETLLRVEARLVVGADGAGSFLRKAAGIAATTHRYSEVIGFEIPDRHLPAPDHASIFAQPAGCSFLYRLGDGRARVMFEVLPGDALEGSVRRQLAAYPAGVRDDIEQALGSQRHLAAAALRVEPDISASGNLVLVGDARGCCHPISGSGITTTVKDALLLRDLLRAQGADPATALRRYAIGSSRMQFVRRVVAEELLHAFMSERNDAQILARSLLAYWQRDARARGRSVAQIAALETGLRALMAEYGRVLLHALHLLPGDLRERRGSRWFGGVAALLLRGLALQRLAIGRRLRELRPRGFASR